MTGPLKRFAKKLLGIPGNLRLYVKERSYKKNKGYCVICEQDTVFVIYGDRLRRDYRCRRCKTQPRNRALLNALHKFAPDWKKGQLHESSPGGPLSSFLKKNCAGYSSSHYYADVPRGEYRGQHRSEDVSALTYPDASFDIFVTSDVFEHVFEPAKAFAQIQRVLKPGGMHVFTMPWYGWKERSVQRAKLNPDGTIEHLAAPEYHGNPIDENGALVTYDWGRDFVDFIYQNSGMTTTIYLEIDRSKGLDAQFLEVFISRKPHAE
jgi:SAM-dependent methyltransferase